MKKNDVIFLIIVIAILVIGGVLAGGIIIHNNIEKEKLEERDTTKTETKKEETSNYKKDDNKVVEPKEEEIAEDKNDSSSLYSNLKEINIDELEEMVSNKETFILLISQTTCSHCADYKPRFNKVLKKHGLKAYYIERDFLTQAEIERLNDIALVSGTPTTIFIEDGEEATSATRIVGSKEASAIEERLKKMGYFK